MSVVIASDRGLTHVAIEKSRCDFVSPSAVGLAGKSELSIWGQAGAADSVCGVAVSVEAWGTVGETLLFLKKS